MISWRSEIAEIQSWRSPPAPLSPPPVDRLHLWWIDIENAHSAFFSLLSDDERCRANRLLDKRDRRYFMCARGAMRSLLGHYLGQPPERLRFDYGIQGKPALHARNQSLCFNLTHSRGRALLAVAAGSPVGIDLEPLRPVPKALALARKVFDRPTFERLSALPESRLSEEFLHCWTLLEARVKMAGGGIFQQPPAVTECLGFQPAAGWCAAVAMHRIPDPDAWDTYRFPDGSPVISSV